MKLWKPLVLGLMALFCMAGCAEKSLVSIECPEISRGCTVDGLTVRAGQQPQILKPVSIPVNLALFFWRDFALNLVLIGAGLDRHRDVDALFLACIRPEMQREFRFLAGVQRMLEVE